MVGSFEKTSTRGGNSLDLKPSDKKVLSIEFSLDGFSFCLCNTVCKQPLLIETYQYSGSKKVLDFANAFEVALERDSVFSSNFEEARVAWFTPGYVIIPEGLYDESEKETYYRFCNSLQNSDNLKADKLEAINARCIYDFPGILESKLQILKAPTSITHSASITIDWFLSYAKNNEYKNQVLVYFRPSCIQVVCLENGKLLFYNSFPVSVCDDALYFLMYVMEKYELEYSASEVVIAGDLKKDSEFFNNLHSFFPRVNRARVCASESLKGDYAPSPNSSLQFLLKLPSCG